MKTVVLAFAALAQLAQAATTTPGGSGGGGGCAPCYANTVTVTKPAVTVTVTKDAVTVTKPCEVVTVTKPCEVMTVTKPCEPMTITKGCEPVTKSCEPTYITKYETKYETKYVTSYDTRYKTDTDTVTRSYTDTNTVTRSYTDTNTVTRSYTDTNTVTRSYTDTVTTTRVTTVTRVYTSYRTNIITGPTNTVTNVVPVLVTDTEVQTETQVNVQTETQVNTAISVQVQTVTVTVASQCPTVAPPVVLTGLVTCTSRIVNPTYTPPAPLPSNYLWGCPPGTICTPPQENCNFEQNPPARGYVCRPEQCKKTGPIPSQEEIRNLVNQGPTCAWLTPQPGYFNLNPIPWGLSFAIFNIYGQPTCPASSAPPSSKTAWQPWGPWSATSKAPESKPTPRSEIQVLHKRTRYYASPCYQFANQACEAFQQVGIDAGALCGAGSAFQLALADLNNCNQANLASDQVGIDVLDQAFETCPNLARREELAIPHRHALKPVV